MGNHRLAGGGHSTQKKVFFYSIRRRFSCRSYWAFEHSGKVDKSSQEEEKFDAQNAPLEWPRGGRGGDGKPTDGGAVAGAVAAAVAATVAVVVVVAAALWSRIATCTSWA